ncbi:hypothetical protein BGZ60DRAFT_394917 [Tricladium varicosporioides]|nr:hypothetical protein BGZ60DRAFT_394917 [Hymenoscyphus varicosporioides]
MGLRGTILITGANGGLGSAFVAKFIQSPFSSNYHGLYAIRNPTTATELRNVLEYAPNGQTYDFLTIDLSSLDSIRETAQSLNQRVTLGALPPIRALVLNAAVMHTEEKVVTTDGYESHFGVNYLANFLFVLLILKSMDKEHGRIILISTALHDSHHWMSRGKFLNGKEEMYTTTEDAVGGGEHDDGTEKGKHDVGMRRYSVSKMLLVMFMYELQRRLNLDPVLSKISVLSLDPGGMGGAELTKRGSTVSKFFWSNIMPTIQQTSVYLWPNGVLRTNDKSATDLLRACFDEENLGTYPKTLFLNGSETSESSQESRDEEKQRRLWKDSIGLVDLKENDTALHDYR